MPSLSPTMEEGTIVSWLVQPGDKVEAGQVIAEVQTDKTVVEWDAEEGGFFAEIIIPAGSQAKVNMVA
ncbi:MAG: biotin/lipoyl-containing protein, partial [Planctomycetota bacterium]